MATVPHSVGLDAALTMLLGGSKVPAGGLQPPVAGQQQHVAPFSVPVQPAASEELITPVNAEANPAAALLLGAGAVAALPPPPPARCLLCNGVGSSGACGPLRPVTVEGQQAMVHDQCAVWSPGCYLPEVGAARVGTTACWTARLPPRQPPPANPCRAPPPTSTWRRSTGVRATGSAAPAARAAPRCPARTPGKCLRWSAARGLQPCSPSGAACLLGHRCCCSTACH